LFLAANALGDLLEYCQKQRPVRHDPLYPAFSFISYFSSSIGIFPYNIRHR
jgi:hypothetical protein